MIQIKPKMKRMPLVLRGALIASLLVLSACQSLAPSNVAESQLGTPDQEKVEISGYPLPFGWAQPKAGSNIAATPSANAQNGIEEDYLIPPPRKQSSSTGKASSALVANIAQARLTANVAVEVDYELFVLLGSSETAARTYVANLFEAVSNVYKRDANIEIKPSFVRVWTTPSEPWTATTSTGALVELRNYWNTYETARNRAAVILLSSRSLGGGVAYLDSICQKDGAYDTSFAGNLTGQVNNTPGPSTWDVVVVAHELGHTFGTTHTHCTANSAGTGFYDQCYGGERYAGAVPAGCYSGTSVRTYGSIMSYCHTNNAPEAGIRNVNPLSFLNAADDPKIKNIIRTNAEKYTVGNDIEGCLVPSWTLNPSFMAPIINLLTD